MTTTICGWSLRDINPYGCTQGTFNIGTQASPNYIDRQLLKDVWDAGCSVVRLQVSWSLLQSGNPGDPTPPIAWWWLDYAVYWALKQGLHVTFPLREAQLKGGVPTWQTLSTPCNGSGGGPTYYFGDINKWAVFAGQVCRRYNGDGGPENAKATQFDATDKRPLVISQLEWWNEDNDVHGDGIPPGGDHSNCRDPLRYVQYSRAVVKNVMRRPTNQTDSASGSKGGGWVARSGDNFPGRLGAYGSWLCASNRNFWLHTLSVLHNPPTDSTYNPGGDHSSVIALYDYVNFHNYKDPVADSGTANLPVTLYRNLKDTRDFLDSNGYTTTPVWCTEFGADGPCAGVSETTQAQYYTANADGTGAGALATLRDGRAQHCDLFTMSYNNPASGTYGYNGDAKSIACKLTTSANAGCTPSASGYVRFQAWCRLKNFIAKNPTWPYGFSATTGGGSSGGTPPPASWITLSPSSGTLSGGASTTVTATVSQTGLSAGSYGTTEACVLTEGALTSTVNIPATLTVQASAGTTYTANPGDDLKAKASVLVAGDTLILNNGTYLVNSTHQGLLISGIHGTATAPITIRAASDGQAIIDGQSGSSGNYEPLYLENSSYVTIIGLAVKNSYASTVRLFGATGTGLDHITLQRITAHGTGTGNHHVVDLLGATITNVLVEDSAAWGPGRYMFSCYHCGAGIVFRRCYGYWNTITDNNLEPRAAFNIYGTSGAIVENCIGLHATPYQTESNQNYFTAVYHTTDDTTNWPADNAKIYGCVFYNNYEGYWLNSTSGSGAAWKDCYFETPQPANTTYTNRPYGDGWVDNVNTGTGHSITNCTFRNSVVGLNRFSGSSSLSISNCVFTGNGTAIVNDPGHNHCAFYNNTSNGTTLVSSDLSSDPGFDTTTYGRGGACFIASASAMHASGTGGSDIGANILYQYVNGQITTVPLWPWPMEDRIMAELGQSPTYTANGGIWTALPPYPNPTLRAIPAQLSFTAATGGAAPPTQTFLLTNCGTTSGTWTAGAATSSGGGTGGGSGGGTATSGTLTGSVAAVSGTINLTTDGGATADWAHWGLTTAATYDHKSGVTSQISNYTLIGDGTAGQNTATQDAYTWTDGTPDASATATSTGVKVVPSAGTSVGTPHVCIIAMENTGYNTVNTSTSYTNIQTLAKTYGTTTNFFAIDHPSIGNYLGLASGFEQTGSDSYNPATSGAFSGNTIVDLLANAGIAWKHYAEYLPSTGYLGGDSGTYPSLYIQHHNPWVYFSTIRGNSTQYNRIVNYTQLATDLKNGNAPPFFFVQPGNDHNAHTGSDSAADSFAYNLVQTIQNSTWYTQGAGKIILWWDEAATSDTTGIGDAGINNTGGGKVFCVVISAANNKAVYSTNVNHYGLLHALCSLYGVAQLGNSAHASNGDLTTLLGGGSAGTVGGDNIGNGFKFSVPATTTQQTLKTYVDVSQGTGAFTATLTNPDGTTVSYSDTPTNNTSVSTLCYTLNYQAIANGQTLTVSHTLTAGTGGGNVVASDTMQRANQAGIGTASDGESYSEIDLAGNPSWSIVNNQAQMTGSSAGSDSVQLFGTQTIGKVGALVRIKVANKQDSAGLILHSTINTSSFYWLQLTNGTLSLDKFISPGLTHLAAQNVTYSINKSYWLRFQVSGGQLYGKVWADNAQEPSAWTVQVSDSAITSKFFGLRGIAANAGDIVTFDSYSVSDLSLSGGSAPASSYVGLHAASIPGSAPVTVTGVLGGSLLYPLTGTINLTSEGTTDWSKYGYTGASSVDHKAGVVQQISSIANVGSGTNTQSATGVLSYTWTDGTPDVSATATATEVTVQGLSNGFQITAPADTNSRTINAYLSAKAAQGNFTASLSDNSSPPVGTTAINDSGSGTAGQFQLTYNAASAGQTLIVQWTMLTDNGTGIGSTTYASDTFVRANNASSWGTASDSETWVHTTTAGATPTFSISSNTGQVSGTAQGTDVALLGSGTQTNAEASVRWQVAATGDTAGMVLRATGTNTFYRLRVTGGNTLELARTISGTSTVLTSATISYVIATKYWFRYRVNGSNLYVRFWADGATEPTSWTMTYTDTNASAITGAGQYGLHTRMNASGDTIKYDSYTVTSIPTPTTPGSLGIGAATLIASVATPAPTPTPTPPPPPVSVVPMTVNLSSDAITQQWLGFGVQVDAYDNGTGTPLGLSAQQRATVNSRLDAMLLPLIRTSAGAVSWWCPGGIVGTYNFTTAMMQEWINVFDYAAGANIPLIVSVNSPSPFLVTSTSWCTAFADLINYLVNSLGYQNISFVTGLSQPDTVGLTYTQYKTTIEPALYNALNGYGLLGSRMALIGPDALSTNDSAWLVTASTDLSTGTTPLGGYARQSFPSAVKDIINDSRETTMSSTVTSILANDHRNVVVLNTEMGYGYLAPGANLFTPPFDFQYGLEMLDWAVQLARSSMSGGIAYDLDDDMHGTRWGFWGIVSSPTIRAWFFPWCLLTQTLPVGSTLYHPTQPSSGDLRLLAAQSSTNAWTFVLVNRSSNAQKVQVKVPLLPTATTTLQQYVYAPGVPLIVDGNGFPQPSTALSVVLSQGFTVTVAGSSAMILTQQTAMQSTIYNVKRPPLQKRR